MRLALLLALAAGPAAANCRLALSLALDVSSSVDAGEYRLQTAGLAAALIAPEVQEAFLATPGRPVMLHVYEWSGWRQQLERIAWTAIEGPADLERVAAALAVQARSYEQYPTAIGNALLYGGRALAERGDCERRTLDVSGDGTSNDGLAPELARQDDTLAGVTINGLVVGANVPTLGRYYQRFVIQGQGSFVEAVLGYEGFEVAMRRKLLRELGVIEMSGNPGPVAR